MQCALCKEQIDDDSHYCDQCGGQIMVCSECGRPGKGNFCIFDGNKKMVPAGSGASTSSAAGSANAPVPAVQQVQAPQPSTVAPTVSPVQTAPSIAPPVQSAQPVQPSPLVQQIPQSPAVGSKIKLISPTHGIMIEAGDGDIIGRKNGAFAGVFGRFNYVSGTHCKIVNTAAGWHIQDMGSTNGTFYNGSKLAPNALYPLASNTMIKIADVELLVTYNSDEGGTSRL